jgi:L-lactate dehydrogenase
MVSDANDALPLHANRVAIIGAGNVGATAAYALLRSEIVREIVLLDQDADKAEGEAMDLQHAVPLGPPVEVRAGDYDDAARSAIAVITAGAANKPGGGAASRLDLLETNAGVVRDCVGQLVQRGFEGILLMTTNPVDVLAQIAQEEFDLPPERVIGTGTVLDTARLRHLLADALGVEARAVDAFILGEHGDSEIAVWSGARVAGVPLADFAAPGSLPDRDTLLQRVRGAAPEVVARKGNTSFAIASCVARICAAILRDERGVLPVSTRLRGEYGIDGVYLSTPCVVGANGVERVIELPLDAGERDALRASADLLRRARRDGAENPTA